MSAVVVVVCRVVLVTVVEAQLLRSKILPDDLEIIQRLRSYKRLRQYSQSSLLRRRIGETCLTTLATRRYRLRRSAILAFCFSVSQRHAIRIMMVALSQTGVTCNR